MWCKRPNFRTLYSLLCLQNLNIISVFWYFRFANSNHTQLRITKFYSKLQKEFQGPTSIFSHGMLSKDVFLEPWLQCTKFTSHFLLKNIFSQLKHYIKKRNLQKNYVKHNWSKFSEDVKNIELHYFSPADLCMKCLRYISNIREKGAKIASFNRDLNRGYLVYMFPLRFSGSKFLINSRRHFRVRKVFSRRQLCTLR